MADATGTPGSPVPTETPAAAPSTSASVPTTRPGGVTILAALYAFGAVVALFAGLMMMLGGAAVAAAFGPLGGLAVLGGLMLVVFAVVGAGIAFGLWSRKAWAWYGAGGFAALGIVTNLFSMVSGDFSAIIGLAISAFVVWYVLKPGVQSWFGVHHKTPWTYA